MITVTITETGDARREWTSRHRTADVNEAISRAVAQQFGRRAFFQQDAGLATIGRYGQVFQRLPGNQATSMTRRVAITAG